MKMIIRYKKCFCCGKKTTDLKKYTCKCGGFLYPISEYYSTRVKRG